MMVSGGPRMLLRFEGLALFVASLVAYLHLRQSLWIFAGLILVPDLCMIAYFAGPKPGAAAYNIFHTTFGPLLLAVYGLLFVELFTQAIAVIWLAHIGIDRELGYGLKYADGFHHTHPGRIGRVKA